MITPMQLPSRYIGMTTAPPTGTTHLSLPAGEAGNGDELDGVSK